MPAGVDEGDLFLKGQGWITRDGHVFLLPQPLFSNGKLWFVADLIDDNFATDGLASRCLYRFRNISEFKTIAAVHRTALA